MDLNKRGKNRIPLWAYLLLFTALIVLVFYIIARFHVPVDGAGIELVEGKIVISAVSKGGPVDVAGIIPGDILKKIGGDPLNIHRMDAHLQSHRAGEVLEYVVSRNGTDITFSVNLRSLWSMNPLLYFALYTLILVVCTTSLYIIYKRPNDLTARLFFIYLQLLAIAQHFRFLFLDDPYALAASIAFIISFNLFGVVLLHFYLYFPNPVPFVKKFKKALDGIYLIGAAVSASLIMLMFYIFFVGDEMSADLFVRLGKLSVSWMGITLILALGAAIYQFYLSKGSPTRKQLRLVVIGSLFGLAMPIFLGLLPGYIIDLVRKNHWITTLEFINTTGTYIMTSFLAIAIFRYRLWNIEPFIRKAILYGAGTVMIYLTYISLIYVVDNLVMNKTRMIHFFVLTVSCLVFFFLRDSMQRLIDRFFFRESFDPASIVIDFEKKMTGIFEEGKILPRIVDAMEEIFHFKTFAFVSKANENGYEIRYTKGVNREKLPLQCQIGDKISELLSGQKVFSVEELSERFEIVERIDAVLIVPLIDEDRIPGFLMLGPKLSERSYSLQDINILTFLSRRIITMLKSASLYENMLERKVALERERTRIARDIHDDVGASLTRISILSEIASKKGFNKDSLKSWLAQIAETSRDVTREMTQIVWAVDPRNDNLKGLISQVRKFAHDHLDLHHIRFDFDLQDELEELNLSVEVRRNIYLVIREVLNNVMKHSLAKNVLLSVRQTSEGIMMMIKDDGHGFNPCKMKHKGNGLNNIRKRMSGIGGKAVISSQEGKGTEVSLMMPIKFIIDSEPVNT